MCKYPSFFQFPFGHSITVCFAELIFTSLIQISAFNPKSRHFVTFTTPRIVSVKRAKVFIWRKVVPPAKASQFSPSVNTGCKTMQTIIKLWVIPQTIYLIANCWNHIKLGTGQRWSYLDNYTLCKFLSKNVLKQLWFYYLFITFFITSFPGSLFLPW